MKLCNQCNQEKPLNELYIDRKAGSKRSGGYVRKSTVYRQPCKECIKRNKRKRYQNDKEFRQTQIKISQRWAQSEKGKASRLASSRKRCKTIKFREYRKWWFKNTVKGKASVKRRRAKWLQTPNGKAYHNRKCERRRARKANAVSTLTAAEWQEILVQYDFRCAYCGKQKPITQDHIIPLTKDGNHTRDNVIPACKLCNSKKGVNLWQPLSSKQVKSQAI